MIEIDVFSRHVLVIRSSGTWTLFYPGPDGKRRSAWDLLVPDSVSTETELVDYLQEDESGEPRLPGPDDPPS